MSDITQIKKIIKKNSQSRLPFDATKFKWSIHIYSIDLKRGKMHQKSLIYPLYLFSFLLLPRLMNINEWLIPT